MKRQNKYLERKNAHETNVLQIFRIAGYANAFLGVITLLLSPWLLVPFSTLALICLIVVSHRNLNQNLVRMYMAIAIVQMIAALILILENVAVSVIANGV